MAETTKHTPGPWRAHITMWDREGLEDRNTPVVTAPDMGDPPFVVADVYGAERNAANARLLAAAPDLLEIAYKLDTMLWEPEPNLAQLSEIADGARAAIAKTQARE